MDRKEALTLVQLDKVRVLDGRWVKRVGYPRSPADYEVDPGPIQAMFAEYGICLWTTPLLGVEPDAQAVRAFNQCERAVQYFMARADGFGGTRRSVHLASLPEYEVGRVGTVLSVRTVVEGTRRLQEEAPAVLVDKVPRALVKVYLGGHAVDGPEFPAEHLERVEE